MNVRGLTIAAAFVTFVTPQSKPFCADAPNISIPVRLLPVDQATQQPDFFTFRARLQVAVASRDVDAVVSMADPGIRMGFGGDDGAEVLRRSLTGTGADDLWKAFARVLALGGAFKGDTAFEAPYIFSNWPDGADSFGCRAVTGAHVAVRRAAAADAPVVTRVSYAIVRDHGFPPGTRDWTRVQLANGRQGYIHTGFIAGPTGLRAIFNRASGQWRMTALVAGD